MWKTEAEQLEAKNAFDGSLVFGTRSFNQRTGRDRHLDHRQRVRNFFLEEATGQLREDMAQLRSCPLCSSGEHRDIFVKDGFPHVRCTSCGMVYVTPMLREEALLKFYEEESSWTEVLFSTEQVELDQKKFKYGLDLIQGYGPAGELLDVGCGPGFFLEAARERGWQVAGMEMNQRCVERLQGLDIPVHTESLEEAVLPEAAFDCVTMWEVLEHLREPRAALAQIHRLLRPRGMLLICVPNFGSLVNRILHEKAETFSGYAHINFFTVETLSHMQEKASFEVLEKETIITELGTIDNYLNFEHPYLGEGKTVMPHLTPQYIHEHMLGSRLLTVARAK